MYLIPVDYVCQKAFRHPVTCVGLKGFPLVSCVLIDVLSEGYSVSTVAYFRRLRPLKDCL